MGKRTIRLSLKDIILNYVTENFNKYLLVIVIFLIGIFTGVIVINNSSEETAFRTADYVTGFIQTLKDTEKINFSELLLSSVKRNFGLTVILWFAGTTVIGIPVVFIILFMRGLSLGYTISAFTSILGTSKGIMFLILSLFFQNVMFIPAILTIGVSSIKLYKSILKDRRKENIKVEIIRHSILSLIMFGVLILASFIENNISFVMLQKMIKYF